MADVAALVSALEERSDTLGKLGYKVRFDLTDGGSIFVDGTSADADVSVDADGEEADTVLKLSSDNMMKLIEGRLDPMVAFSTGRLKVKGSQGVALKLASLLND